DRVREPVLEILPDFLDHPNVLGVGEVGYDAITPEEEDAMIRQINMAIERNMPVMVHTPHRDKARGTERTMDVIDDLGIDPSRVIVDHSTEETTKMILDRGYWAGHTVYPNTKLTPDRFVYIFKEFGTERMMLNSSADWGDADPLNVPKTAALLESQGCARADIQRLVWNNVIEFYGIENMNLPAELLEAAGMSVKI
ncbi:MAG: TatD family hydrolase, partial [Planctomycetes bacterium]|nr:TatD family hydrolase [Planctomycetota bacterium]